jgi:hypothetical protein
MLANELQNANAEFPISVSEAGSSMLANDVQ